MQDTIVVVGAGHAAAQAVDSLRKEGFQGRLAVVGDEPHPPYQRPPLSKRFLAGEQTLERLLIRPASWYAAQRAELRLGVRAEGLDLARRQLRLSDGDLLGYDRLVLATGTTPRRLVVPGSELGGIHYLRTVADVDRIRAELAGARHVVVVGAGYIGLEVAATCRGLGLEVDVLEMADRVMNRVVAPEVSAFYAQAHAAQGVRIHGDTLVAGFEARLDDPARVGCVHAIDGRSFPADVVVVGIGVVPVTGLAAEAGLACENGIAVDAHCRTSDPQVYAIGDCTNHPSPRYHRRIRLESVDNAFEQARTAAANLVGREVAHDRVPWFWSDQYDLKLLIVGLNFDYDRAIVRGDPATRAFSCCYLRDRELLAIDCVNSPKDFMAAKKLVAERARFDLAKLADCAYALPDAVG